MVTIVKTTSKGQITLPAKWRKHFDTNQFIIREKGDSLEIKPLDMDKLTKSAEYTVFDALRDNKGRGIKASDMVKVLKEMT